MTGAVARLVATALACAVATAGCGIGPGEPEEEGLATLTVTRDFGAETLAGGTLEDPTPSETVVRFLDRHADIETDYGDNFVSAIDGLEGSTVGGGDGDWFFFVNGIYSEIGAGEAKVRAGERIWWDHRDWSAAYRVPAVVGSFPEPFLSGYDGEVRPVVLECLSEDRAPCDAAEQSLRDAGVDPEVESPPEPVEHADSLRILVGGWDRLRTDRAARRLESGPAVSGVYAELRRCSGGWSVAVLGADGEPRRFTDGGLLAAVREGDDEPTWVITGATEAAVAEAASMLDEDSLASRYALATSAGGEPVPAPAPAGEPAVEEGGCR